MRASLGLTSLPCYIILRNQGQLSLFRPQLYPGDNYMLRSGFFDNGDNKLIITMAICISFLGLP